MLPGIHSAITGRRKSESGRSALWVVNTISIITGLSLHRRITAISVAVQPFAVCDWTEPEQLFGPGHTHHQQPQLQPGIIHQVNGGFL